MSVDVRVALGRLTAAFERHLEVVAAANPQNEDAVERAYYQLEEAFLVYEEALDTAYGEVLPIEVAGD
jgi:hypothetical protein